MLALSSELSAVVAARHGIVRNSELIGDGMSTTTVRRLVRDRALVPIHRGVVRLATSPDTFEARASAACLADEEAFVTGIAAGRLWGFRHVRPVELPIVVVAHDRHPFARGVIVRRCSEIDRTDIVLRHDAIRVASPPRAWFDCARDMGDEQFEALTEWVLDHHAAVPTLWATARRLAQRGRPGSARVRRVTSQRASWQRPADSRLELKVLRALERNGVGPLVRQHPLRLPNGVLVHVDGADPDIRWALEIDHVTWHGGRLDAQADKGRDRQLRRIRWQVDRITDQECREDFDRSISELVELYRLRCDQFRNVA